MKFYIIIIVWRYSYTVLLYGAIVLVLYKWFINFEFRTTVIIAFLTFSFRAIRIANVNPLDALKYE